ncbi:hypothetical protein VNO80_00346 [Phaseolus coccineus]|uniref:Uncharacterized protein n=1 Tax=Phaseolus coccineus TaxID=3886 RepID=A0AAN9RQS9_PHACN
MNIKYNINGVSSRPVTYHYFELITAISELILRLENDTFFESTSSTFVVIRYHLHTRRMHFKAPLEKEFPHNFFSINIGHKQGTRL